MYYVIPKIIGLVVVLAIVGFIGMIVWIFIDIKNMNEDIDWCEENGGRWIDAAYNRHCEFLPIL